ncbi:MAG: hypothetical protein KAS94_04710, partial [Desulfobulbaceae bacterium]|nr:hypothetical protein [Desulfobulbaceae bacterium]
MVDSRDIRPEDLPGFVKPAEVSAAEKTVKTLVAALRNFGLFPPNHATTINMLAGVHRSITGFMNRFDDLCLQFDKTRILYNDYPIHDGPTHDENPIYIMYRDGLRWLEFEKGLSEEELKSLLQIFQTFRETPDEHEEDFVSALWHLDLSHVFYRASDNFWEEEPVLDFSAFDITGKGAEDSDEQQETETTTKQERRRRSLRPEENKEQPQALSVALIESGKNLYQLDPIEKTVLEQDIKKCVEQDSREDIIGLMLHILNVEQEQKTAETIMNHLKEELKNSLVSRKFATSCYLLGNLQKIQEKHNDIIEWPKLLWKKFYEDISKPEMLSPLIPIWQETSTLGPDLLKDFTNFLRFLPPKAAETFTATLDEISKPNARSLMVEIIASFATRNMNVLDSLLLTPVEDLGLRLLRVVNNVENKRIAVLFLQKAVGHKIAKVRTEAQKAL